MEEGGANAAFDQAAHGGIRMVRRWIVVAPIDQRGGAAVDLVQRANQRRDIDVVGRGTPSPARHACGGNIRAASSLRQNRVVRSARCACVR